MNRVDDKVAIVTGGGSGIGAASSELLGRAGACVVVTDINETAAQGTAATITEDGGRAIALHQDVVQESGWTNVIASTTAT